jgi:hypothetical protein
MSGGSGFAQGCGPGSYHVSKESIAAYNGQEVASNTIGSLEWCLALKTARPATAQQQADPERVAKPAGQNQE